MKSKIVLAALVAAVGLSGYALGQNNQVESFTQRLDDAQDKLTLGEWSKTLEGTEQNESLIAEATGKGDLTRAFTKQAVSRFYSTADPKAAIRLQAMQIAQNQRIIELLEKLNAK